MYLCVFLQQVIHNVDAKHSNSIEEIKSKLVEQFYKPVFWTLTVQNMKKLGQNLPKPCYADARPNTPSAWVVADQKENEKNLEKGKCVYCMYYYCYII